ncbi:MAG: phosphoglucosamine mutase [Sedimentisphaerales bacterium]|nr:phosphoglucosamine mutase [Sedimentisphaerales bacterium]
MAKNLIISISGMRGIIGENLTPDIVARYGCAFGAFLKEHYREKYEKLKVCIGRDSRPSGPMLASAIISGLNSVGIDVIDLGIVTTPCVGIMLRNLSCAGGIVITASHNPIEYNGIKLLLDNGIAPPPELSEKIKKRYYDNDFDLVDSISCGKLSFNDQTDRVHIDKVISIINPHSIEEKRYKVVLDSVNGAGGRIGKTILNELGCEVIAINNEMTGIFAHTPEPTKENLVELAERVKEEQAMVGFAQDPDGDRLAIVDENGFYIGEEYTLALAAKYIFSKMQGPAAANLSTSRMIDDIAAKNGSQVIRTPVGEANVADAMIKNNCVIGGEGNGGVIDLRVGPIRDSIVGMAMVLQLMAETGKTISQLVNEIGGYYVYKTKAPADGDQAQAVIEKVKKQFPQAKLNTSDGCRLDFEDGWVHIRTSNTEPIMRIIVETVDQQAAAKYIYAISNIQQEVLA